MKTIFALTLCWLLFDGLQPVLADPQVSARRLPELMPSPDSALNHAEEIGLANEQQTKLQSEMAPLQSAVDHFTERVRQESNALAQLLAVDKPDEAAVAAQFEKVIAAEDEVKRVRMKMSLRTRAVLTAEQQSKLDTLLKAGGPRHPPSPEQRELAAKMERVKGLIERAKSEGRDLVLVREMWKRVDQAAHQRNLAEAGRMLDDVAKTLEDSLAAPAPPKP